MDIQLNINSAVSKVGTTKWFVKLHSNKLNNTRET